MKKSFSQIQNKGSYIAMSFFVFLLSCGLLLFIFKDNESNKKQQALNTGIDLQFNTKDVTQIEYGSKVEAEDFVKTYKGTLEKPEVDTKTLGPQKLKYVLSVDDYEKTFYKRINVVDSQFPEIKIKKGTSFTVEKGEPFHLDKNDIVASDPVDGLLEVNIRGEVNTKQTGNYVLNVSAVDSNGNRSEQNVTVSVRKAPKTKSSNTSTGDKLDNYSISGNTAFVRGRNVQLLDNPKKEIVEMYLSQMNATPAYLFEYVDNIIICSQEKMERDLDITNTGSTVVIGHTVSADGKSVVYLNGDVKPEDDTVVHEFAHAYGFKTGILELDTFEDLFKREATFMNKNAAKTNIGEFFAYTYALYVTQGQEALAAYCPNTAQFYAEYQI